MKKVLSLMFVLALIGTSAQAGWFDDALNKTLQKAGERGIEEAVDATYDGAKNTGKKAMESGNDDPPPPPPPTTSQQPAPASQGTVQHSKAGVIEDIDIDSINMKPGNWTITATITMPGMPMAIPPQTYTDCINKDNIVPQNKEQADGCKVISLSSNGDTVLWTIECINEHNMVTTGYGSITYRGKTFNGVVTATVTQPNGGKTTMNTTMKGQYVGPCPK